MDYQTLTVNGWNFSIHNKTRFFSQDLVRQGLGYVNRWTEIFPSEGTWVNNCYHIPSLIIRLDCVVDNEGRLMIYELEDRPAGAGLSNLINPEFAKLLADVRQSWPKFTVLTSEQRKGNDDILWLNVEQYNESSLVLVRAEPDDIRYHHLVPRSVSTVKTEGDKGYGVVLGLWREVTLDNLPDKTQSFVIKPLQGTRAQDVLFWVPYLKDYPGTVTWTKIQKTLSKHGKMYCQPFILPMQTNIPDFPYMIYRVFFVYDIALNQWQCLGGCWVARNNLKIHGATDSLIGPLTVF